VAQSEIPELPADHHQAVDWARLRRALRLNHPLRTGATICAGIALAPLWTSHATLPVIAAEGTNAAIGLAGMAAVYATAVVTNSRLRPLVRRLAAVALVAAVVGTLYAEPVRHLIAARIMEH